MIAPVAEHVSIEENIMLGMKNKGLVSGINISQ